MPSYGLPTSCPSCNKIFTPVIYVTGPQVCCSILCKANYKIIKFYDENPIINSDNKYLIVPLTNGGYFLVDIQDKYLVDKSCWRKNNEGYVYRSTKRNNKNLSYLLHREIFKVTNPKIQIDHINLNKLDNRRSNLREVLHFQNGQNLPSKSGSSIYRGVRKSYDKWESYSHINNKNYYLGRYRDEIEAAKISESFRRKHMKFSVPILSLDPIPDCKCKLCK